MRSVVRVGTVVSMIAAAVAAAACGSSSGPLFPFPIIGGTYTGSVTYQMTGDPMYTQPLVPGITIQLNDPDGNGNFNGAFQFNTGFTETGNIVGQFSSDQSTINWEQFGDAGFPLFYLAAFNAQNYPNCNFQGALFSLNGNGGFDGNGNLTLAGTFTGIRCATDGAGDSDSTALSASLAAFNPTPQQGVVRALGLHSVIRGGVQRVK
jgi:hypothetical protein